MCGPCSVRLHDPVLKCFSSSAAISVAIGFRCQENNKNQAHSEEIGGGVAVVGSSVLWWAGMGWVAFHSEVFFPRFRNGDR